MPPQIALLTQFIQGNRSVLWILLISVVTENLSFKIQVSRMDKVSEIDGLR